MGDANMAPAFDEFGLPIRQFRIPEAAAPAATKLGHPAHTETKTKATPPDETEAAPAGVGKAETQQAHEDEDRPPNSDSERHSRHVPPDMPNHKETVLAAEVASPSEPTTPTPTDVRKSAVLFPNMTNGVTDTATAGDSTPKAETQEKGDPLAEAAPPNTIASPPRPSVETTPKTPMSPNVGHSRDPSSASTANGLGISEFSHQQVSLQPAEEEKKDDDWQEMPAYARYDMYDDDDRLIARERNEEEDEGDNKYGYAGLGGAGKGYTRVVMDEDAQSATSMDEHTQYLFKEANGTSLTGAEEDEARDAVSQMRATKDLLTEGQRIAYVGVVRLEIANIVKDAEGLEITKSTRKLTRMAAEAMKMWGQKMMIRLYAHMDISEAEQVMIEQLAEHGVMPGDLTPALHANARVVNPMADEAESTRGSLDSPSASGSGTPHRSPSMEKPKESSPPPISPDEEKAAEPPPPYESVDGEDIPEVKMPSQMPTTDKIDIDLRWTVLCDLFLVLVADSVYDARSRVLLERVGASLGIDWCDICRFEKRVTDALEMQQAAEKENWNEDEHMEHRRKMALRRRYVMMGLATVGGGLVIGLSAGLLAPVIGAGLAAGFTTIGVTGTTGFLAGAGGAAVITSGAAASGGIIGIRAANRRTGAVKTFEYRPLHNNKRVNLIVTVAGWLTGKVDDVRLPFSTIDPMMGDIYSVLWEPEMLRSMGDTINILATEALTQGLQQILGSTILISLMAALQLPIVLTKLSYLIDNPWTVSLDRAVSAGHILADSLIERNLGTRPITLVGYSLGSRVIFSCLQELAKKGAFGLIQNVYLFGSPVVVKKDEYLRARSVVAGRFVNGYHSNDWILGYLFRLTNGGIRRVAGLGAIEDCPWIENVDVTELVAGHMEYRTAMPSLLMKCGWMVESEEFTEIEDPDPENHQERQRELITEIEEARKELEREGKASTGSSKGKFGGLFKRKKKGEREEWEVYEDSGEKSETVPGVAHRGVLFDVDAIRAELAKEAVEGKDEELQIRELQSTLPPMKLDLSSPTPASSPAPPSIREMRSAETLPIGGSASMATPPARSSPGYAADETEGIHMTFDDGFDSENRGQSAQRPAMHSSQTLPNMALADPWGEDDEDDFGREKEISMTFA